jgi:hypothetical protein
MTDFADVKPTVGAASNSYEKILDIQAYGTGTPTEEAWVNVPDITAFNPTRPPITADTSTWAHKGGTSTQKTGESFSATFNVLKIRNSEDNDFQDYYLTLLRASEGTDTDNLVHVRWYDALGASEAYQGIASVQVAPQTTGNAEKGWDTVTLTGDGKATPIANPLAA